MGEAVRGREGLGGARKILVLGGGGGRHGHWPHRRGGHYPPFEKKVVSLHNQSLVHLRFEVIMVDE